MKDNLELEEKIVKTIGNIRGKRNKPCFQRIRDFVNRGNSFNVDMSTLKSVIHELCERDVIYDGGNEKDGESFYVKEKVCEKTMETAREHEQLEANDENPNFENLITDLDDTFYKFMNSKIETEVKSAITILSDNLLNKVKTLVSAVNYKPIIDYNDDPLVTSLQNELCYFKQQLAEKDIIIKEIKGGVSEKNAIKETNSRLHENNLDTVKHRNELITVLKDQVESYKVEAVAKNALIEKLVVELSDGLRETNCVSVDENICKSTSGSLNTVFSSERKSSYDSNHSPKTTHNMRSDYMQWQKVGNSNNSFSSNHHTNSTISLTNRYNPLMINSESEIGNEIEAAAITTSVKTSRNVKRLGKRGNDRTNNFPENDVQEFTNTRKHVPGNSSYADVTRHGKKVVIFSDSTTSRIKMGEFNKHVMNGRTFRKNFPGATPSEVAHYCTHTLEEQQPDTAIIHVGTNALQKDETCKIAEDILNIVTICKNYGVNSVLVSGITYRRQFKDKIDEINTFINARQLVNDFVFIYNGNINERDIWKDKVHLSDNGTTKLANNFIKAINSAHSV